MAAKKAPTKKAAKALPKKTPASLGAQIDKLWLLREKRLKVDKESEKLKSEEYALKQKLIKLYKQDDLNGARGKLGSASIDKKDYPTIKAEDWDKTYAYIKKNNAFELLQRRINEGAVRELWALGKQIPGVGKFTDIKITVSRAKK